MRTPPTNEIAHAAHNGAGMIDVRQQGRQIAFGPGQVAAGRT
jgi:hypothetical protein